MSVQLLHDEAWHATRREGIGGSDAAVVLGLSKYKTPRELWKEKIGISTSNFQGNRYTVWGNILEEPVALAFALKNPQWKVRKADVQRKHKRYPFIRAHYDRIAFDGTHSVPLEIKTADARKADEWSNIGEPIMVPPEYYAQLQHQIAIKGSPFGILTVLIGGNDDRTYFIPHDDLFIKKMLIAEVAFWQCVLDGIPPEPITVDDAIDAYTINGEKAIEANETQVGLLNELDAILHEKAPLTALENREVELKKLILLSMEDAKTLLVNAVKRVMIVSTKRQNLPKDAVLANFPEAEKLLETSESRYPKIYAVK